MALTQYEPDTPPVSGEMEDYVFNELQRIADVLNENFDNIEKRLIVLETP